MAANTPDFWQNPPFTGFNSYDQSTQAGYRQQSSTHPPFVHPDWSEQPDQGNQRIHGSAFSPTFQSSVPYLSQPNPYSASPGSLVPVQHQRLNIGYPSPTSANVNADSSSGLPGGPFLQSNEDYRMRSDNFPPQQQHTTFTNQILVQIPAPPALYHPGGQLYRRQGLPFSDVSSEGSPLDLFEGSSMHSRVPSQDGCVWYLSACHDLTS